MPTPKYCWDSCVFIAILSGEERTPEEKAALLEVVDAADRGAVIIVTSAMARAEVLEDVQQPRVRELFDALFRRPNFLMMDVSAAIAERAGEIRQRARASGRRIESADAAFIATALAHRVDAFHTLDDRLLNLDGSVHVDGLHICKPSGEQTILNL